MGRPFFVLAVALREGAATISAMQTQIFETALGLFGIGWTDSGIARVHLPGLEHEELAQRLAAGGAVPSLPTREVEALMERIEAYAEGQKVDFSSVTLDLTDVPDFHRRAYAHLTQIGWGDATTYGAVARHLGDVNLSRAVGQAMGANPVPLLVPCHRVLASNGKAGGFSAPGGAETKLRMLALEGSGPGAPSGQLAFGF